MPPPWSFLQPLSRNERRSSLLAPINHDRFPPTLYCLAPTGALLVDSFQSPMIPIALRYLLIDVQHCFFRPMGTTLSASSFPCTCVHGTMDYSLLTSVLHSTVVISDSPPCVVDRLVLRHVALVVIVQGKHLLCQVTGYHVLTFTLTDSESMLFTILPHLRVSSFPL